MGYALMFARALQNTAKKNRLNYESMNIQNRQTQITNQLTKLQQQEDAIKAQVKDNGGISPDLAYLSLYRDMLNLMSKNMEARLKGIQTELAHIAAEEQGVNDALAAQIEASTPKYVGM